MPADHQGGALPEAVRPATTGVAEPEWLLHQREVAMARFADLGLPSAKEEAWRFSDVRWLRSAFASPAGVAAPQPGVAELAPYLLPSAAHCLVFVDGVYAPHLSTCGALQDGVWVGTAADAVAQRPELLAASFARDGGVFAVLNAALFASGLVLHVAEGVCVEQPIALVQYRTAGGGLQVQLRHVVCLEAGASATLVEAVCGVGDGGSNVTLTAILDAGAKLNHAKLQDEAVTALHLAQLHASLQTGAALTSFLLTSGARLSRQEVRVDLAGEHAALTLNGTYLLGGDQEASIVPFVDHQAPTCETHELFKGVLQDRAHGVFLGTILVREGADGTNAHQQNRNLLASPAAHVDTRPELTIYAEDVKCSHGATVGDLDDNALFYLLSRGIDAVTARGMLMHAFAADSIECSGLPEPVQAWLRAHLARCLGAQA